MKYCVLRQTGFVFSLFLGLLSWVGCDSQQPDDEAETMADFELVVSQLTPTSCHFSVVPADAAMSYVVMFVDKTEFDAFEDEYKYQDNDLEWFERKAMEEGKDLNEWLADFLHTGPFESDESGLVPDTSYYLYAYGLSYDGYFTTGITKLEFSTPEIEMTDVTFDVQVSEIGVTKAKVNVTASRQDAMFFVNVFSLDQYEQWGGDDTAFANHAASLVDYYIRQGQTLEAILANIGSVGSAEVVFDDLTAGTEYLAYAVAIDENFYVTSVPFTQKFTTGKSAQSSNTFSVDIQETTYCSVIGTVTPSNDDPFVCVIQAKSQLADYGSDSDLMYDVVGAYQKWGMIDDILYAGETVDLDAISSLSADTEYVILCFGWEEAPTTGLTKVEFTTERAGGNPLGQEFIFVLSDVMHNKATVNITPKLGVHYFYDCMAVSQLNEYIGSEGSEDAAICRFLDERIDYGADFFECTRTEYLEEMGGAIGKQKWTFTGLEEDTEYIIAAASVNMTTGQIVLRKGYRSEVFRTTVLIESDASIEFVIDKYYDGTELAELDPSRFHNCKGSVMVPYKIIPNDEAVSWRTTFAYGAYLDWAERDDVLFELDYKCDRDKTQGYAVVAYDQIVSFLGIAEDASGHTGPFVIYEFQAKQGGASDAQEFIDSLI